MLILYWSLYYFKFGEELLEPKEESSTLVKVIFLVIVILDKISYYLVVYFNIVNIKFTNYLRDTYGGLNISNHFENASIFIKKS